MVVESAQHWGEQDAVIDGACQLSFQGLADLMAQVAQSLIASGIKPGDRVAIWAPNSISWIPAALGVLAVGAWLVPLNTRLKGEEAAYILDKTDAAMLLTVDGFLGFNYVELLRACAPSLRALNKTVILPNPGSMETPSWQNFLQTGESVDSRQVYELIAKLSAEDISDIIFTSGTTGQPKGVMLRHGASLKGYGNFNHAFGLNAASRYIITTPFFHCFGYKAGWMMALMHGAASYPVAIFDGRKTLELISENGITHMGGSPTMFTAMLDDPEREKFDLSTLETAVISASSIPEQVVQRVRNELGISSTLTGYGLTEHHGFASLTQADDDVDVVITTAGKITPDIEARVVDTEGNDVSPGEDGELLLRGYLAMSGYYEDEKATAETLVDGWLHTGDIVRMNPQHYITITDRKKDIYIMGGFNVAPAEVEQVLLSMEGISQIAVVAAPDEKFGEVGAAFIIAAPDSTINAEQVIQYAREHLANYKVPRYVEFVDGFPLNAMGKVLKRDLKTVIENKLQKSNAS
jgi:acyl-CoA synthetase (AMP-forming)/AMP-acid ligase II